MQTHHRTPRTRRQTQKALTLSIVASCHGMVWVAVALGMPLTMFLEALGASGLVMGSAMAVQQISMGFQLPGGLLANRLSSLKGYWFSLALPHRIIWLAIPILPFIGLKTSSHVAVITVVIVGTSAILGNLASPAWFGWMSEMVPSRESGRFWSIRQGWTMLAFLVATALSGWILDGVGRSTGDTSFLSFSLLFAIAAAFGVLDIVIHARVPPPEKADVRTPRPWTALGKLLRDRHFRMLTLAFGLWGFSIGLSGPFAIVYLKRVFEVTYTQLAVLTITFSMGTMIIGFLGGRIMDTIGARSFGSIMLLGVPLFAIPWFLLSDQSYALPWLGVTNEAIIVIAVVNFLSGAFFSGGTLCQINLLTTMAKADSRTLAMALHFTITGILGALGPTLGGMIMDALGDSVAIGLTLPRGLTFSFFHVQLILHILFSMTATWIFHKTTPAVTDVPVRQLLGNPLRTLTIIQNLITVTTPRSEKARAKAIQRLSNTRIDSAMTMLKKALEDPSSLVRREAIQALSRSGSSEAITMLIRHYENNSDPESHPSLAQALGNCDDNKAVPVLIAMLNEHEETRLEAIRSLGRVGGYWERQPLIDLLQSCEDPDTIEAVGQALARMAARHIRARQQDVERSRKLTETNSEVAIAELIESLRDPSPQIQEATLDALGGRLSPTAMHALADTLHDADPSVKQQIARALARNRHTSGIDTLIADMTQSNPKDHLLNIRILGETRDRRASGILIDMLRHSEDPHVISASSEALVHLREIAAFYDIIPRMKTTRNPLLRRTLAVAASNLLSEDGNFYAMLMHEDHMPGSQTARRLGRLQRRIRRLCARGRNDAERTLITTLQTLEAHSEAEQWTEAAERLFDLSMGLAVLTYGIEHSDEKKVFIEKVIWHDERLGVNVWFLYMITHEWNNPVFGPPTQLDVLIGVFGLTEWSSQVTLANRVDRE